MINLDDLIQGLQKAVLGVNETLMVKQLEFIEQFFEHESGVEGISRTQKAKLTKESLGEQKKQVQDIINNFLGAYSNPRKKHAKEFFRSIKNLNALLTQEEELEESISQAKDKLDNLFSAADSGKEELYYQTTDLNRISNALEKLHELNNISLEGNDPNEIDTIDGRRVFEIGSYRPRTVTVQYPQRTQTGMKVIDVSVPLITLVPMALSQIDQLKMRMGLEVQLNDDKVCVSFPDKEQTIRKTRGGDGGEVEETTEEPGNLGYLEITVSPKDTPDGLKKLIEGYSKILRSQLPH